MTRATAPGAYMCVCSRKKSKTCAEHVDEDMTVLHAARNMVVTIWETRGMQTYNGSGTNNLTGTQLLVPYAHTVTDTDVLIIYMILHTHTTTACIIYKCINTLFILACYTCALMIGTQRHACTHKHVCTQHHTLVLKNPFARLFPLARQVAVVHEDIVSVFEDDSCNSKETDVVIYLQQRPMYTCAATREHCFSNTKHWLTYSQWP